MASFRKRGDKWSAEICVNNIRKSKSFPTKAQAKSWANEAELSLADAKDGIDTTIRVKALFERYAQEISSEKKGARWEQVRLNKFCTFDLADIKLVDIRREDIEDWMELRLKSVKPSSVNRELNLMSHCFTQARRWRLMKHNPMDDLKRPKNPPHRDRRISDTEADTLLLVLNYSDSGKVVQTQQRVAVALLFAIETGMRAGEIVGLVPENIDLNSRVAHLPTTKNDMARDVPLSSRAVELLEKLKPWPDDSVFRMSSETLSTLFRKAVGKAGIEDLTFHDSRHEAITRLADKLDVLDLARMVGHRDIKQLMTYYNKSARDLAKQLD